MQEAREYGEKLRSHNTRYYRILQASIGAIRINRRGYDSGVQFYLREIGEEIRREDSFTLKNVRSQK